MSTNKKNDSTSTKKKKFKFSVNPLLCTVIILVLIPVGILSYSIMKSVDSRGVPVVGNRYDNQLVNKLSDEQLEELKTGLVREGIESVDVTLNAATVRVTIKFPGLGTSDDSNYVAKEAYDKLNTITPVEKYFTNFEGKKSYDLEIHVYNSIPKSEEEKAGQIYSILTKTGSMSEPVVNVQTTPKSEDLTYHLMNPITTEQLQAVKAAVNVEGQEAVEVRLTNGSVIISVKVPGLSDPAVAAQMSEQVYGQMATVLPIEDYFSNRGSVERYRLEIHVFNLIPEKGQEATQVAAALSKSSGNPDYKIETSQEGE